MKQPLASLAAMLAFAGHGRALADGPVPRDRPNIVYILADDLGYGDFGRLNRSGKIATPVFDRLAAEGVTCTDAHSGSAVCTPTRYGLLTGRYAWRSRLKRGVLGGYSPTLIEPGRPTVPAFLASHGYATACVGKWHLGMTWPVKHGPPIAGDGYEAEPRIDFARPIADGPLTRVFGSFFGISASLDMPPYVFIEGDRVVEPPTDRQPKAAGYVREGAKGPSFRFGAVLPALTDRSVRFIGEQATLGPAHPFFLYLPLNAPHTPISPSAGFVGKSGVGDYGDFVMEVDASIGRVLDALRDRRLADNTLVIVTSDNGPERMAYPRIREYHHYSMGELRGIKRDAREGGHRVPFLARWPGKIPPGSASGEVICHVDLMATVAAILGVPVPAGAGEDSVDILPALMGRPLDRPLREATVHHTGAGKFAIRQGSMVLIDAPTGDENDEPDWFGQERGYATHALPGELYDLARDPAQGVNLYAKRPDDVKRLKALLEKYKAEGRSVPAKP
ncbi:MAG TPA: arylsulfatase [Isosphaeraceae bacterium]